MLGFYRKHSLSACCIPVLGIELEQDRIASAFLAERGEGKMPQAPESSRKEMRGAVGMGVWKLWTRIEKSQTLGS